MSLAEKCDALVAQIDAALAEEEILEQEGADLFGVDSLEDIADYLSDEYVEYMVEARS